MASNVSIEFYKNSATLKVSTAWIFQNYGSRADSEARGIKGGSAAQAGEEAGQEEEEAGQEEEILITACASHSDRTEKDPTSIYRSKRAIEKIVKLNEFNYFVTLTFAEQNQDAGDLLYKAEKVLRASVRSHKIKRYLLVPELTKKGVLHLHGFIACESSYMRESGTVRTAGYNKPIKYETYLRKCQGQVFYQVYNFVLWDCMGFSVCERVKADDELKTLRYILKYITKGTAEKVFSNRERPRRYFCGGQVEREPHKIYLDSFFQEKEKFTEFFENLGVQFYSLPFLSADHKIGYKNFGYADINFLTFFSQLINNNIISKSYKSEALYNLILELESEGKLKDTNKIEEIEQLPQFYY